MYALTSCQCHDQLLHCSIVPAWFRYSLARAPVCLCPLETAGLMERPCGMARFIGSHHHKVSRYRVYDAFRRGLRIDPMLSTLCENLLWPHEREWRSLQNRKFTTPRLGPASFPPTSAGLAMARGQWSLVQSTTIRPIGTADWLTACKINDHWSRCLAGHPSFLFWTHRSRLEEDVGDNGLGDDCRI